MQIPLTFSDVVPCLKKQLPRLDALRGHMYIRGREEELVRIAGSGPML
jgi:hypothetical protein